MGFPLLPFSLKTSCPTLWLESLFSDYFCALTIHGSIFSSRSYPNMLPLPTSLSKLVTFPKCFHRALTTMHWNTHLMPLITEDTQWAWLLCTYPVCDKYLSSQPRKLLSTTIVFARKFIYTTVCSTLSSLGQMLRAVWLGRNAEEWDLYKTPPPPVPLTRGYLWWASFLDALYITVRTQKEKWDTWVIWN